MGCGRYMCKDPDIYSSLPLLLYTTPAPYQGHQSGVGGGKTVDTEANRAPGF